MSFPSVSALLFAPLFPLDRNNSGLKFCRCVCGPIPQLGGGIPNLWIWYQQILPPDSRIFQLMSPLWVPGMLLISWHMGLSGCYPKNTSLTAIHLCSISWPVYTSSIFYHTWFFSYFPLPLFSSSKGEFISEMQAYFNICSSIKCNARQNIELHYFPKAFRIGA